MKASSWVTLAKRSVVFVRVITTCVEVNISHPPSSGVRVVNGQTAKAGTQLEYTPAPNARDIPPHTKVKSSYRLSAEAKRLAPKKVTNKAVAKKPAAKKKTVVAKKPAAKNKTVAKRPAAKNKAVAKKPAAKKKAVATKPAAK